MPTIVADGLMPLVESLFSPFGPVTLFSERQPSEPLLAEAEVLLVRSVTRVDEALLAKAPKLRFVGTATIGTDHIDAEALRRRGITLASAPGCNADAVSDYVLSALLNWQHEKQQPLTSLTVGIVGVGNIGSRVARRLEILGVKVLCCDPPRAAAGFVSLAEVLAEADVVTLHVPGGPATRHLLASDELAALKPGALLINSCRGSVIDNDALVAWLTAGGDAVLDVFANEPEFDPRLQGLARWLTPHIAGHSFEGKRRGTWMLYQAWCQANGQKVDGQFADYLPAPTIQRLSVTGLPLRALANLVYDIRDDDMWFRQGLMAGHSFDWLRRHYPLRREWASLQVDTPDPRAVALGFGSLC
ncbi:4-phosphoerythronate dehydrogenase [Gallaecimonas sp. GXIMD1310]|uniref:4-phosphoerythronate dehydrogenase n=1 Tax=Gallaecimonas sp. GXIMD1310 TaxID=3131926 RepID=UPI0032546D48